MLYNPNGVALKNKVDDELLVAICGYYQEDNQMFQNGLRRAETKFRSTHTEAPEWKVEAEVINWNVLIKKCKEAGFTKLQAFAYIRTQIGKQVD